MAGLIELVAIVALLQYFMFGMAVGKARRQYKVKAPAMSGHPMFDRIYRVQANTLEGLIMFLPALFLAAKYWADHGILGYVVAALAVVSVIGRHIYARSYVKDPSSRHMGFGLVMLPILLLLALAVAGIISASL